MKLRFFYFLFFFFIFLILAFPQGSRGGASHLFPNIASNFRFNFINPGGRATGMGGAFIATANDATASETNPAGLIFIPKTMVFSEYRRIKYTFDTPYYSDEVKVYNRHFTEWVNSPTFLSLVFPHKDWAVAIYRQELANFKISLQYKDMVLPHPQNLIPWVLNRKNVHLNFHLTNYGISFAKKLHETFAVGISLRTSHLDFNAIETSNLDPQRELPPHFPDLSFNIRTTTPDNIGVLTDIDDEDWKISYVIGCQWRPADQVSLGVVYRYGASHHVRTLFWENIEHNEGGQFVSDREEYSNFEINVPDRLGFGFSLFPTDKWTFSFDVVRIFYTDLNDQFVSLLNEQDRKYYKWEDGNEYRFGFEYTIPFGLYDSLSLRMGYYASPDPSFHYLGNATLQENPRAYLVGSVLNRKLGYDHHFTFGTGLVIFKNFQVDVAGDLGRDKDLFVTSFMYNF